MDGGVNARGIASRSQRMVTGAKNVVPGSRMGTGAPRVYYLQKRLVIKFVMLNE